MPDHPASLRALIIARLALASAALVLFAMLAAAVRAGWMQQADVALLGGIRGSGGAALFAPIAFLTDLGSFPALTAEAVVVATSLLLGGHRMQAARLVAIVAGGRIAVESIKLLVARARPPLVDQAVAVHSFSFPSSRTANATIAYCAFAFALTHAASGRHRRRALLTIAALLALAIGASRVWLGVHWPVDVLAGWLFGIGWLALCAAVPLPRR